MPTLVSANGSQYTAVTATSAQFTLPMGQGAQYLFRTSTDCWVFVGATGGAAQTDAANNHVVKAGGQLYLCNLEDSGSTNSFVHVIRNSADGDATLTLVGARYL